MRSPSVWLAACSCALALAGCGKDEHAGPPPPRLPTNVARGLVAANDRLAASLRPGGRCGAPELARRLQGRTIAAINRGAVPASLQEELLSRVNELAEQPSPCARRKSTLRRARSLSAWLRRYSR